MKSQHLRQVWPPSARLEFPIGQMVPSRFTDGFGGARGESRTLDPRLKRALLYQLSYTSKLCGFITVTTWLPQPFSLFSAVLVGERGYDPLRPRAGNFKFPMSTHSITRPFSLHLPKSVLQSPLQRKLCNPYTPGRQ